MLQVFQEFLSTHPRVLLSSYQQHNFIKVAALCEWWDCFLPLWMSFSMLSTFQTLFKKKFKVSSNKYNGYRHSVYHFLCLLIQYPFTSQMPWTVHWSSELSMLCSPLHSPDEQVGGTLRWLTIKGCPDHSNKESKGESAKCFWNAADLINIYFRLIGYRWIGFRQSHLSFILGMMIPENVSSTFGGYSMMPMPANPGMRWKRPLA